MLLISSGLAGNYAPGVFFRTGHVKIDRHGGKDVTENSIVGGHAARYS